LLLLVVKKERVWRAEKCRLMEKDGKIPTQRINNNNGEEKYKRHQSNLFLSESEPQSLFILHFRGEMESHAEMISKPQQQLRRRKRSG
jgi:hypothetical protein